MIIKNTQDLVTHGKIEPRKICIDLMETALRSVDLYKETKRLVRIKGNYLLAVEKKYDLSKFDRIFVLGAGKATFAIAKALEEILGEKITDGVISVKKGETGFLDHIRVFESSHPLPGENSKLAADEIFSIARRATSNDLFICAITGGASSLLVSPVDGISLDEKIAVNKMLLESGAPIIAINSVRNHLSKIKGGNLAQRIFPGKILNLIAIDEIEGLPWGPTVPDRTTFNDSVHYLKRYDLWEKVPASVRSHLSSGSKGKKKDTPKESDLKKVELQNVILASNEKMLEAVRQRARQLKLNAVILISKLEAESKDAGKVFGCIAAEIESRKRPVKPPCVLIAGGETTVTIDHAEGTGGPSQEFVLGAALEISNTKNIAITSLDTDGTDGPTSAAGGIVDSLTLARAEKFEEDIVSKLASHSSYELLEKLKDQVITGVTGTNVMDLDLAVILSS